MNTIETLRQRLVEAEVLLREASSGLSSFIGFGERITDFLNQKGGDVTDYSGIVEQQKQRIAELERLHKAAEERAERLQAEIDSLKNVKDPVLVAAQASLQLAEKECEELRRELATLKSVRVLSGEELEEEWLATISGENAPHWDRFAERLQLRCTCPLMSAEELYYLGNPSYPWEVISNEAREAWEFRANHIWPKVESKPTREEVAGRIVEAFRNNVLTVFTLDGVTAITESNDGGELWSADRLVASADDIRFNLLRTEAEQAAKDMLVDAVMGNHKPDTGAESPRGVLVEIP